MDAENENASGSGTQGTSTSPKQLFNPGTQEFADIVGTAAFIDKTLFIKAFLEEPVSPMVVLALRRFGKSTNMNMLQQFLSGKKDRFKNLKIYKDEKDFFDAYCNLNPIIYVDFKGAGGETKDAVIESLKRTVGRAFNDNKHLVTEDSRGNWTWTNQKVKKASITVQQFVEYFQSPKNLTEGDVTDGLRILSECLQMHYSKPVYVFVPTHIAH